tara:strand:+ start:316 stop:801 length:486 start_codon:yes stop_codon:yes gene_type:complete
MFHDPTFWVLVAFIAFILTLVYMKVPGMVSKTLDARSAKIRADLDEAEALLKESQDLLASYQRKQQEAENEAEIIRLQARKEADRIIVNGRARLDELLKRREDLTLERINQAEATAIEEIRSRIVEIAMNATRNLLSNKLSDARSQSLLNSAIKELPGKLN